MSTPRKPVQTSSVANSPRARTTSSRGGLPQPSTTSSAAVRTKSTTAAARDVTPLSPVGSRTRTTSTVGGTSSRLAPPKSPSATRTKSPARTSPKPPSLVLEPKQNFSIREVIALKRAEAKKGQLEVNSKALRREPSFGDISAEEKHPQTDEFELSRWSIRDSIERARSSGNLNLASRSLSSIPSALFKVHLGIQPEPLKLAPKESEELLNAGRTQERPQTAWFEAADLTILKLRDNVIVEIQPEVSLFGSLKTLDLRNNQLTHVPNSLADLVNLISLDLSKNQLTSLPEDLSTLPLLTTLDISSNKLTTLPLSISTPPLSPTTNRPSSFFSPALVNRATEPLPSLKYLLASGNKIQASLIPADDLPPDLVKVDLANNPLGNANALMKGLSKLTKLKQLILEKTELQDDSFISVKGFPVLELLDLGKTSVTETVQAVFLDRHVSFDGEVVEGGVRVILANRIQKEAWEIEAEKRRHRTLGQTQVASSKEPWEIEAEMGLLTEAGRRRARAAAAAATATTPSGESASTPPKSPVASVGTTTIPLTQYYDPHTSVLTLPRSSPPMHSRTRSLAPTVSDGSNLLVPPQTLPLPIIVAQPFAQTLRCLVLTNRRFDTTFNLPATFVESEPLLPLLEELHLDNTELGDNVTITFENASSPPRKEPIFNLISALFPKLSSLDLSDNKLTSLSGIRALLIPDPARKTKGLKSLRVRGNKINDLVGLEAVAQVLKSEGHVDSWALEELDLRDNEIAKLPPMLGYLLVDVLLVEGNTFRIPARRVWEREGTKGLLNWLKGRVE